MSWRSPLPVGYDQRTDLDFEPFYRELSPTTATPILGLPGLTAPVGAVPGKPIGVQLIASRFGEPVLLSAATALERAMGPMKPVDPAG